MDLTKLACMSREELAALQDELRTVATAADAVADSGHEPEISLTADRTGIHWAPLTCFAKAEPPPQLLERDLPAPEFALDPPAVPAPAEGGGYRG